MPRWDSRPTWDKEKLLERLERNSVTNGVHKLWQGRIDERIKYPRIQINGRKYLVHRVGAYIHLNLNIKNEFALALHKTSCPYKNCWSKECLYIGTQSDNMKDAHITGARSNTNYKNQYTKE